MATFRIAHVSDLHFGRSADWLNPLEEQDSAMSRARTALKHVLKAGPRGNLANIFYPSTFNPDAAISLLRCLHNEAPYLDAILVTGDIATTGEAFDLDIAKNYFFGLTPSDWNPIASGLPSLLNDNELPLLLLPGNHDRYSGLTKQPTSVNFESRFGNYWDFDRDHAFGVGPWHAETGRVRITLLELQGAKLAILMADLSLESAASAEGGFGYIGQGRAVARVVQELAESTKNIRQEVTSEGFEFAVVWAVHFPPKFPGADDSLALLDSELLVNAAASNDVFLIFAGHTHQTLLYDNIAQDGKAVSTLCSGPSAGVSSHGAYSFSIIDIELTAKEVLPKITHYSWEKYRFVEQTPVAGTLTTQGAPPSGPG